MLKNGPKYSGFPYWFYDQAAYEPQATECQDAMAVLTSRRGIVYMSADDARGCQLMAIVKAVLVIARSACRPERASYPLAIAALFASVPYVLPFIASQLPALCDRLPLELPDAFTKTADRCYLPKPEEKGHFGLFEHAQAAAVMPSAQSRA